MGPYQGIGKLKIHHFEDVFLIDNGDFPASHVSFQGCKPLKNHFGSAFL